MIRNDFRVLTLSLSLTAACQPELRPPESVCDEAVNAFLECGVSVPLLDDGRCTGLRRSAAECVLEYDDGCDDLARLSRGPDRCFADLIDIANTEPGGPDLFDDEDPVPDGGVRPDAGFELDAGQVAHPGGEEICTDGQDNDGDGDTDCFDADCSHACSPESNDRACADGEDNDGDGRVDCDDENCADNPRVTACGPPGGGQG